MGTVNWAPVTGVNPLLSEAVERQAARRARDEELLAELLDLISGNPWKAPKRLHTKAQHISPEELAGYDATPCGLKCSGCGEPLETEGDFARHFVVPDTRYLNLGYCPVERHGGLIDAAIDAEHDGRYGRGTAVGWGRGAAGAGCQCAGCSQ